MKLRTTKLLQAAMFSSVAALTCLVACSDDEDPPVGGAGTAGSSSTAGSAGTSTGGNAGSGSGGSPAAGTGGKATGGSGGTPTAGSGGTTTAGTGGTSTAGSGGTTTAGTGGTSTAGSGGTSTAGMGGEAGGDAGSGGDGGDAGAGGSTDMAGAGGMGGAPDVPAATNLSIGKVATASTQQAGNGAPRAIDGDVGTRWCASDNSDGNWLRVDLGAAHTLTGAEIVWEKGTGTDQASAKYKYKIELSTDDAAWTQVVDQSANVSTDHTQAHTFAASARYVRVTVLDVDPSTVWACTLEVRVMGY